MRGHRPEQPVPNFEELVERYTPDVWMLCRHLGDPSSADDLAQETFLRAYTSLPGFRGESSARTWVLAIARRVCADHVQRMRRDRLLVTLAAREAAHEASFADPSGALSLWDLVARLPHERRAAFVLTQVFGLSYQEAAEACDCAIGTIRSRVARARTDLIRAQEVAGGAHRRGRS